MKTGILRALLLELLRIAFFTQLLVLCGGRLTSWLFVGILVVVPLMGFVLYRNRASVLKALRNPVRGLLRNIPSLVVALLLIRATRDSIFPDLLQINSLLFISIQMACTAGYLLITRRDIEHSASQIGSIAALLGFLLFSFYLANDTRLVSADTRGNSLLPFTILNGTLALDQFVGSPQVQFNESDRELVARDQVSTSASNVLGHLLVLTPAKDGAASGHILHPYYLVPRAGKFYSIFPILPGLVNTSVLVGLRCLGLMETYTSVPDSENALGVAYDSAFRLQRITAALLGVFAVVILFSLLTSFLSVGPATFLALVYAVASPHYSISSQGIWQHGVGEFLIASIGWFIARQNRTITTSLVAGALIALLIATRPSNLPVAVVLALACIFGTRMRFFSMVLGGVPVILGLVLFNWIIFGNLVGGYGSLAANQTEHSSFLDFLGNPLAGAAGLLFSPGRGLFFYAPFLCMALWSAFIGRTQPMVLLSGASIVVHVVSFALVPFWWGGASVGPRYLTEVMPLFFVLLYPLMQRWATLRMARILFITGVVAAFSIQILLVVSERPFVVWNSNPHINSNPERLWSFRRPPFIATLDPYRVLLSKQGRFYAAFEEAQRELFENDVIRSPDSQSGYLRVKTSMRPEGVWIVLKMPVYLRKGSYEVTFRAKSENARTELKLVAEGEQALVPVIATIAQSNEFQLTSVTIDIQKSGMKAFNILATSSQGVALDYIEVKRIN